ncbi:MAG TPA: TGS domain-containing protein [Syntrophales bacterium]|nr:TGS domain-containing protein [Syntrophales bacterium]
MPANLPPQYFEAEQRFREAQTPEDKIEALEEMLAIMPKHKGTDKLKAMLRERISKLKDQAAAKKGTAKHKSAYAIEREGALQAVVAGAPNTGKSSLVARLTNANPEVAPFPHSTHKPTPGMAPFENIQFQLIDTPPLTPEYADPGLLDLMRRTDMVLVLVDLLADPVDQFEQTMDILHRNRIFSPSCPLPENLAKKPVIKKMLILLNKADSPRDLENLDIFKELTGTDIPAMAVSTKTGLMLMDLLAFIYELSGLIRVYTKRPGKEADLTSPFVLPRGSTLEELAGRIHKDFPERLKFARIWGKTVREGQRVQRDYVLQEGDIVELGLQG